MRMSAVRVIVEAANDGPSTIEAWVSEGEALGKGRSSSQKREPSDLTAVQP